MDYFNNGHLVMSMKVVGNIGLIRKIWEEIEREMKKLDFEEEKRDFVPHITIGRGLGKQPMAVWTRIGEKLKRIKLPKFPLINIDSIDLMESIQTKEGSEYERLYSARLR